MVTKVKSGVIAANSITSANIVNGTIVSADIAANTIATSNIADNAVDATKIASNSILTRHIDDNQINIDQLNVSVLVLNPPPKSEATNKPSPFGPPFGLKTTPLIVPPTPPGLNS